jgi:hypothetical protein
MVPNILELIKHDHAVILKMLDVLTAPVPVRHANYTGVKRLLLAHMYGEETTIYERMRPDMPDRVEDSLAEHNSVRVCFHYLDRIDTSSDAWSTAVGKLKERVQFHVDAEERLLKAAESCIGESELYEMAEQFQRARDKQYGYTLA